MIRLTAIAVYAGMLLIPAAAQAQSEADQEACTPDVFRLCQEFIPNEGPIVSCLESKRVQLSPACLRVMFPPTAAVTPAPAAAARPNARHTKHRHHRAKAM